MPSLSYLNYESRLLTKVPLTRNHIDIDTPSNNPWLDDSKHGIVTIMYESKSYF